MAAAAVAIPPLPPGFTLDAAPPPVPPLPPGFTLDVPIEPPAALPPVTAGDRAMAVPSGINAGIAGTVGLPVDTALNVWDLAKAGAGYTQSKITGRPPSEVFDPADRSEYPLSSEWNAGKLQGVGIATEAPRPDDTASRYIHAASTGIPGALTGGAGAPNIARQAAAGIASGTAAEGAKDLGLDAGAQAATALAVGAGASAARIPKKASPAARAMAPSKQKLKADSQAAYKRAEDAGVVITPESFAGAKARIADALATEGIDPTLHPATTAALKRIVETEGPVTLKGAETLRKIAKSAETSINPADKRLAGQVIDELDSYMEGLGDADVTAGDPAAAVGALTEARGLWSRQRKADIFDQLIENAELKAPNHSASGMQTALKNEFKALALNQKRMRGFTPEEQAAIERVVKGDNVENALRWLGKAAPTGIVSGALSSGAGLAFGGPLGAVALPAAGYAGRHASTRMTRSNVDAVHELVRRGPTPKATAGSLADELTQAPAVVKAKAPAPVKAAAIAPRTLGDEMTSAAPQKLTVTREDFADFMSDDMVHSQRAKLTEQGYVKDGKLTAAGSARMRELVTGEASPDLEATFSGDELSQPISEGAVSIEPAQRAGYFNVLRDGEKQVTVEGEAAARSLADDLMPAAPAKKEPYGPLTDLLDELGMTGKGAKPGLLGDDLFGASPTAAKPNKPTPNIPRAATGALSDADLKIETDFATRLETDLDGAIEEYNKLPDTDGGRIINTDSARELSSDYRADRTKSAAVHEPASHLTKQAYARKLAEAPAEGQDATVLFSAGGTGAGKSTALASLSGPAVKRAQIIYDTNMNTLDSATKRIEQALEAGKNVSLVYVWRDPVEALVEGALPRAMRMGRTVPLDEHAKTHVGAAKVVKQIAKKYADDPRVSVQVIDNAHGKGKARLGSIDKVPALAYDDVRERLETALEAARDAGSISDAVYSGTKGAGTGRPSIRGLESKGGARTGRQPQQADPGKVRPLADELAP